MLETLKWQLDPARYPSYFQAPVLPAWGGDPVKWEIAVIALAIASGLALCRWWTRKHSAGLMVCGVAGPLVLGLTGTVYMIHRHIFWEGVGPVAEDFTLSALFPSQIGLFCTAI